MMMVHTHTRKEWRRQKYFEATQKNIKDKLENEQKILNDNASNNNKNRRVRDNNLLSLTNTHTHTHTNTEALIHAHRRTQRDLQLKRKCK